MCPVNDNPPNISVKGPSAHDKYHPPVVSCHPFRLGTVTFPNPFGWPVGNCRSPKTHLDEFVATIMTVYKPMCLFQICVPMRCPSANRMHIWKPPDARRISNSCQIGIRIGSKGDEGRDLVEKCLSSGFIAYFSAHILQF